jgi:hypothetical protein
MLLTHYQNHLKENSRLDLMYFLYSHYSLEGDGISSDDNEEQQMPFMQRNHRVINITLVNSGYLFLEPPSGKYYYQTIQFLNSFISPIFINCLYSDLQFA